MQIFQLNETLLSTKFGRRLFFLFVLCAVLPVVLLVVVSFGHVKKQLNEQSQKRLHRASKSVGLTIYERLLFLEAEMRVVALNFLAEDIGKPPRGLRENIKERFIGLVVETGSGREMPFLGAIGKLPQPTSAERNHLSSGKTLVSSQANPDLPSRIFMRRALDRKHPSGKILLGEVNPAYLWGLGDNNTLPPMTELCVLDQSNHPLMCSVLGATTLIDKLSFQTIESSSGQFEWGDDKREFLARYWAIPMKFQFFAPQWTVVLSESKADVFAPMADFRRTFPFVVVISLLLVLLLSIRQIRRSLVPLERLKEGARRIARRDFTSRVEINSTDEFQELADSFNGMAVRLGRQFSTLAAMGEIDRAILSVLDIDKIVNTVLTRWQDIFPCDYVSVSLLDSSAPFRAQTYLRENKPGSRTRVEGVQFTPHEVRTLRQYPAGLSMIQGNVPPFLAPLSGEGIQSLLVLPILVKGDLSGIVCLGYMTVPSHSQEDLISARQLADQVAVALSNARDVAERRKAQEEVQHSLKRLVALRDIYLAVSSTLDLETLLDLLLRKIELLLPGSAATIWLVDGDGKTPHPVACRNLGALDSGGWETEECQAWGGIPNAAFENRALVQIDDLPMSPDLWARDFFRNYGLVSYLGVPLITQGKFLGALSIYLKKKHSFSNKEVDFYLTLAGQVAIAIHNSQLYQETKDQTDKLARANKVKNEFLSVMSHELRTPLTVIMGLTETMHDGIFGEISSQQKDSLKKMAKQSHDLLTMINSIMEVTGLESEAIQVEEDEFGLEDFLNELRSTAYGSLLDKNLSITWDFPSERVVMKTDRTKIKRILQNLIHNAIKFTHRGRLIVSARFLQASQTVEFRVADTGIGIPQEVLPVIFEKFAQKDSSETRAYGGVGLGLYIVKAFTELLRGTVQVDSQPGLGSTFTVRLPATYQIAEKSEPSARISKGGKIKRLKGLASHHGQFQTGT